MDSLNIAKNNEKNFEKYKQGSPFRMQRILFIDDDENIRSILSKLLKKMGYNVEVAGDGQTGIKLFDERGDFDLVVIDIRMPNMDGNEVARYIRDSQKSNASLIAITGFPEEILPEMFDYTLIKPFSLKEFGLMVRSFDLM